MGCGYTGVLFAYFLLFMTLTYQKYLMVHHKNFKCPLTNLSILDSPHLKAFCTISPINLSKMPLSFIFNFQVSYYFSTAYKINSTLLACHPKLPRPGTLPITIFLTPLPETFSPSLPVYLSLIFPSISSLPILLPSNLS